MRFSASCQATRSDRLSGKRNRRSFAPMTSSETPPPWASGNLTKLPPQFWRFQQAHESVRQRRRILARDNNPAVLFAASEDICNSWHVGCDHRQPTRHCLQERHCETFPSRRDGDASAARRYDHSSRRSNTCRSIHSTLSVESTRCRATSRSRPSPTSKSRMSASGRREQIRFQASNRVSRPFFEIWTRPCHATTRVSRPIEPGPDDVPIGWLRRHHVHRIRNRTDPVGPNTILSLNAGDLGLGRNDQASTAPHSCAAHHPLDRRSRLIAPW